MSGFADSRCRFAARDADRTKIKPSPLVAGEIFSRCKAVLFGKGNINMAKSQTITAQIRDDAGKGASRRLRRAGLVPGILYGAGRDPRNIQLNHNEVLLATRHESFFSSILELNFDGKKQKVLVRDWQTHPFRQQMLHMDFMRIRDDEEIRVSVPVHFLNQDESPAGKTAGVVISHNLTEVEVACLPPDLPEYLEIDLANLEEGDLIHLTDIKMPEKVKIVALMHEDHDYVVVSAHKIKVEVEPVETDEAEVAEGEEAEDGKAAEASADGEGGDESSEDKD